MRLKPLQSPGHFRLGLLHSLSDSGALVASTDATPDAMPLTGNGQEPVAPAARYTLEIVLAIRCWTPNLLQLTDNYSVATPVNWKDGEDVIIAPSLQDAAVLKQKLPKGYNVIKPYLRYTPQPNK